MRLPALAFDKAYLQWLALAVLIYVSWGRGAGPERASAVCLILFIVIDPLYHWIAGKGVSYGSVDLGHLAIDSFVGALMIAIALRANRIYPLFAAAWQLLAIMSHIGRMGSSSAAALAYSIMMYAPSYLILVTLTIGLAAHIRRTRLYGPYRSWWNDCPPWQLVPAK